MDRYALTDQCRSTVREHQRTHERQIFALDAGKESVDDFENGNFFRYIAAPDL